MIDMLIYAKNVENFKVLGATAFFFVLEWNVNVEILNI